LQRAEAAQPGDLNLRWVRAGHFERIGDTEAAIAIYEDIYKQNSNLPVIANNLASLLSTTRTDAESLERAYIVARRLRDSDIPAFADTYGWLAFKRGELEDAKTHLERAVRGLPNEAAVHYHLGRTYLALGSATLARDSLQRAALLVAQGGHSYPGLATEIDTALVEVGQLQAETEG